MTYADTHTHTRFSTDSAAEPLLMLKTAKEKKLPVLCFTDHFDLDFPSDTESFLFDPKDYFTELSALREQTRNEETRLNLGIEIGLRRDRADLCEELNRVLPAYPFDYVIGSVHIVDDLDPYHEEYWRRNKNGLLRYFEDTYENVKQYQNFDSLGHLDYAVRYLPDSVSTEKDYRPMDYLDLFTEIFKILISNGKALEINTNGLRRGLSFPHPKKELLKLYASLGGELVTLGSDAHKEQDIAAGFDTAVSVLRDCGFRYYAVFTNRKPELFKL